MIGCPNCDFIIVRDGTPANNTGNIMYQVISIFTCGPFTYQASKRPGAALPYSVHLLINDTLHNGHYFKDIQKLSDYISKMNK